MWHGLFYKSNGIFVGTEQPEEFSCSSFLTRREDSSWLLERRPGPANEKNSRLLGYPKLDPKSMHRGIFIVVKAS